MNNENAVGFYYFLFYFLLFLNLNKLIIIKIRKLKIPKIYFKDKQFFTIKITNY